MTQHKQSHRIKWHDHHIKWHDMHQNRSHHHHGTAEASFTAKKWFGHRAGRSPCAHSIGKFFLCYIVFFFWNFRPRLARELLVLNYLERLKRSKQSQAEWQQHRNTYFNTYCRSQDESKEADLGTAGFETFKAHFGTANATQKRHRTTWFPDLLVLQSSVFSSFPTAFLQADDLQTSIGGSTKPSDTGSAIVANLADLTKLGASETWWQESQIDWRH